MKLLICVIVVTCFLHALYGLKCMRPSDARLIRPLAPIPPSWINPWWHTGPYLSTKHSEEQDDHYDVSHDRGVAFTPTGTRIWWMKGNNTYYFITQNQTKILCAHTVGGLQVNWFENTPSNRDEDWCQWNIEVNPENPAAFRLKNHIFVETMPEIGYVYFAKTGIYFDYNENSLNDARNFVNPDRKWFLWQNVDENQRNFSVIEDECVLGPSGIPDFLEPTGDVVSGRSAGGSRKVQYLVSSNKIASCSAKWFLRGNKCYRFFKYNVRQSRADYVCRNYFGGSLAIPRSREEQTFMRQLRKYYKRRARRQGMRNSRATYWLGIIRQNSHERFSYKNGDRLTYTAWGRQASKFATLNYNCAYWRRRGWFASDCNARHKFACVRNATEKTTGSCGKIQQKNIDVIMRKASGDNRLRDRIVNGASAEEGQFPWQVSLRFKTPVRYGGVEVIHNCGGTLIDECWVLTAAHCVPGRDPNMFTVRLGDLNNKVEDGTEQEFDIEKLIVHSEYTIVPSPRFDIALVKLRRKNGKCATLNRVVQPACLPDDTDSVVEEGKKCQVSGWGVTNTSLGQSSAAANLMWVTLPKLRNNYCKNKYNKRSELFIDDVMFCAGLKEGGRDSCTGDSGGPYVCRNDDGKYVLTGIVSFGVGCARRSYPGVYTNVAYFLPWITSNIRANGGGNIIDS